MLNRRKRSLYGDRAPSINPYQELNALLSKAENKKRKLTVEYLEGDPNGEGPGSLERVAGLALSEMYTNNYMPPSQNDVFVSDGKYPFYENTYNNSQVLYEEDVEVIGGTNQTGQTIPGRPVIEIETEEESNQQETSNNNGQVVVDYTKGEFNIEVPQKGSEEEGKETQVEQIPVNDITVVKGSDKNSSEKQAYYVKDVDSEGKIVFYKIKFLEGLGDESEGVFMYQGHLYYYNQDENRWSFYEASGHYSDDQSYYATNYAIGPDGTYHFYLGKEGHEFEWFYLSPNEDGYFKVPGWYGLYGFDTATMGFYQVGDNSVYKQREEMIKLIGQTYGAAGLQEFMYNNYGEYYSAWKELYPGISPITEVQYNQQKDKLISLQWMYLSKGPEYVAKFLAEHPEWSIAQSMLHPETSFESFYNSDIIDHYNEYVNMSEEEQQIFKSTFELQWVMQQKDVQEYFQQNMGEQLDQFMEAQKEFQAMASEIGTVAYQQKQESVHEVYVNLVLLALSLMGAEGNPVIGWLGAKSYNLGPTFAALQVIRMISFYGYNISLAPTPSGVLINPLISIAKNWKSYKSIPLNFEEGLTQSDTVQFMKSVYETVDDASRRAMQYFRSWILREAPVKSAPSTKYIEAYLEENAESIAEMQAEVLGLENESVIMEEGEYPTIEEAWEILGPQENPQNIPVEYGEILESAAELEFAEEASEMAVMLTTVEGIMGMVGVGINVIGLALLLYSLGKSVYEARKTKKDYFDALALYQLLVSLKQNADKQTGQYGQYSDLLATYDQY